MALGFDKMQRGSLGATVRRAIVHVHIHTCTCVLDIFVRFKGHCKQDVLILRFVFRALRGLNWQKFVYYYVH